ncbi:MAG: S41 family peptidase [Minisyncoccales bacterium]|jgi:carboxyl-terminal processing protease
MRNYKKTALFVTVIGLIAISFMLGYFAKEIKTAKSFFEPKETDISLMMEAYLKLKRGFVDPERLDEKELVYGAINGMVNSLDDPYTIFLNEEDTKRFIEDAEGKFEGVGMEVGLRDDQFQVIAPLKDTPADKSGLLPGDKILEIDGVDVNNLSVDKAVNLIRGPKGTEVRLLILRDGWGQPKEFVIVRDVIEVKSIEWELIGDDIAHIKLYHFSKNTDAEFKKIALDILGSGAKGIILDMRNNPGGYLEVAKQIGGWFMERGEVFVIEDSIREKKEDKAPGTGRLSQHKIVVLINQGSASASEILAGALRDNKGTLLVGEKSFGKGSIQSLERLSDGSSVKITTAYWLTPKGERISDKGLEPDIRVEMSPDSYGQGDDIQLEAAIEAIKGMI